MFRFPWGDMHSLNLGWFLQKFNELREDWATAEAGIDGALDAEIQKAEDALSDVFDARDAAAASATAAAGSASAANTSKTAAQNSATAAASSATLANQKATAAGLSEAAAAQSATAASNSASAAATSATQAGQSAAAAQSSAAAAAASEQNVESTIENATTEAIASATQTATSAATNAANSATAAANSATAAAGSATAAAGSATAAEASAQRAEEVEESIPADYTTLSNDVDALKTAHNANYPTPYFPMSKRQLRPYIRDSRRIEVINEQYSIYMNDATSSFNLTISGPNSGTITVENVFTQAKSIRLPKGKYKVKVEILNADKEIIKNIIGARIRSSSSIIVNATTDQFNYGESYFELSDTTDVCVFLVIDSNIGSLIPITVTAQITIEAEADTTTTALALSLSN